MVMSAHDYQKVANAVGRVFSFSKEDDEKLTRLMEQLEYEFYLDNPRFNTVKFRQAVNIVRTGRFDPVAVK